MATAGVGSPGFQVRFSLSPGPVHHPLAHRRLRRLRFGLLAHAAQEAEHRAEVGPDGVVGSVRDTSLLALLPNNGLHGGVVVVRKAREQMMLDLHVEASHEPVALRTPPGRRRPNLVLGWAQLTVPRTLR